MLNWILNQPDLDKLIKLSDGDNLVYEKEVAYVGQFYKKADDLAFEISEEWIDHWVNVQAGLMEEGVEVPMPFEHRLDVPRKATALEYAKRDDSKGRIGLFAKIQFKDKETAKDLKDTQTSIYVEKDVTTGKGTVYQSPITHIAWTEYPVIPGMDKITQIAASLKATPVFTKDFFKEEDTTMKLSELAKSLGIEVGDDEPTADTFVAAFSQMKDSNTSLESKITELEGLIPKPKDKPVIAAGVLTMGIENRQLKIDKLLDDGYINPAQSKSAVEKYCSNDSVVMAMSSEAPSDDFLFWVENEKLGAKQPLHGESDTQLNEEYILKLSNEDINDPTKNPVHKAIAAMAKAE